ncbi:hypothetical protein EJA71_03835 [Pseudomonas sp. PB106]|nr:hypothetical protein EJA71_03835 [Pseudomonas sp. PB106]
MKTPRLVRGVFFACSKWPRYTTNPCGSWLASDSGVSGNRDVCCADVIAGKPAPTGFQAVLEMKLLS